MNHFEYVQPETAWLPVIEDAFGEIRNYTISFILNQRLVGSGTLIRVKGSSGILTAHHVSKLICREKEGSVGLNISSRVHSFFVPVSHLKHLEVGPCRADALDEDGPDLAFLRILDLNAIAVLESKKSFYHLDGKSFDAFRQVPLKGMIWAVAGSPDEWSRDMGTDQSGERILKTKYLVGQADFEALARRREFDYLKVTLLADQGNFPINYGGVSGGGIWLVPLELDLEEKNKRVRHRAPFLSGVAYCQSEPGGTEISITGHGPDSVYRVVPRFLEKNIA